MGSEMCIRDRSIFTAKLGANLSHSVSEKTLQVSFGIFLIVVGILVIVN